MSFFPKPLTAVEPNTREFESNALVKPTGFREYDARWWFGRPASPKAPEINLMGIQALGMGLGTLIAEMGQKQEIVTAHDFRGSRSPSPSARIRRHRCSESVRAWASETFKGPHGRAGNIQQL